MSKVTTAIHGSGSGDSYPPILGDDWPNVIGNGFTGVIHNGEMTGP